MKTINSILVLLSGLVLFSCGNQQKEEPKVKPISSDTTKTVSVDAIYFDESEISSFEYKDGFAK